MCGQQGMPNMPYAQRKAIYTLYIGVKKHYFKPDRDSFYSLLSLLGDISLLSGVVLLTWDYFIPEPKIFCLPCYIQSGFGVLEGLSLFMANPMCSHIQQVWFLFLFLGIGFILLGEYMGKL